MLGNMNTLGVIVLAVGAGLFVFGMVIIGIGEKNSIFLGLLYLFLCLIPVLNIISLVIILKRAVRDLKRNSYQVRILGVRKRMVPEAKVGYPCVSTIAVVIKIVPLW
jgi:hypothetical protein